MQRTLETIDIRKVYSGTVALEGIGIRLTGGRISALVGKNGAGKSTLVKILAGTERPTSGRILIDGKEVTLHSAQDAFRQGIATVYQELSLIPGLTVAENIYLGRLPQRRKPPRIHWAETFRSAQQLLDGLRIRIDARAVVRELGVAQRQMVEIAKAMSFNPAVLMLDEPTSALAQHESENLAALLRELAAKGVCILYISHRLQELANVADEVIVLRDGKYIGKIDAMPFRPEALVEMMFGKVVQQHRPPDLHPMEGEAMRVENFSRANKFQDISFTLRKGEILGIAGMLGSGRTELLRAIFGADRADSGFVSVHGGPPVYSPSPTRMKRLGVAFAPEDRKEQALVQILSTRTNVCLASLRRVARRACITKSAERKVAANYIDRLAIKVTDADLPISSLSGGNQQKIVVGKWLNINPRVILYDEPTRGIDVQAKQQIFQSMWELSREGIGFVFVSSELEELVEVCHRILIIKRGRIEGEVAADAITADELYVRCMEE